MPGWKAKTYRERAAEWRRMAESALCHAEREAYAAIAEGYDTLAALYADLSLRTMGDDRH